MLKSDPVLCAAAAPSQPTDSVLSSPRFRRLRQRDVVIVQSVQEIDMADKVGDVDRLKPVEGPDEHGQAGVTGEPLREQESLCLRQFGMDR